MANLKKGFFGRRANAEVARLTKNVKQLGNAITNLKNSGGNKNFPRIYKSMVSTHESAKKKLAKAIAYAAKRDEERIFKHGTNQQKMNFLTQNIMKAMKK